MSCLTELRNSGAHCPGHLWLLMEVPQLLLWDGLKWDGMGNDCLKSRQQPAAIPPKTQTYEPFSSLPGSPSLGIQEQELGK